jgi:hypothetical protein
MLGSIAGASVPEMLAGTGSETFPESVAAGGASSATLISFISSSAGISTVGSSFLRPRFKIGFSSFFAAGFGPPMRELLP